MTGHEYARAQRRAAFVTALEHPDAATRERAQQRVQRWTEVLDHMAAGTVQVGSRAPIEGVPAWATPEVVRGGLATGRLAAAGPLGDDEIATARQHGLLETRAALFAHALSPAGLAELLARLDDGCYRAEQPEETALLTVAWLHRGGEHLAADRLVAELRPWADRLRFTPRPAAAPAVGNLVERRTVAETREALDRRQEKVQVARMRETLAVWNPLRDELVEHWRATLVEGRVGAHRPPAWVEASAALRQRYDDLAEQHRLCAKPRRPDDNLAIMLRALHDDGALRLLAVRLPRMAIRPPERGEQAGVAARPTHPELARGVSRRLEGLDGIDKPETVLGPVTPSELPGLPDDEAVPVGVGKIVRRARRGTVDDLVADGTIPSAEVLAELTPVLTASAVAADAPDPSSRRLLTTGLRAFAARRSLLLTGLAAQVRAEELPWIAALQERRTRGAESPSRARMVALGELAVRAFPETPIPNPLVEQLQVLGRAAGEAHPLLLELAADIFEGRFSRSFARAASLAGDLLDGTLYARYYGLRRHEWSARGFSRECRRRAGEPTWSVAGNGTIIEQAQALTTHNLVVLAGPLGVRVDWEAAARQSLAVVDEQVRVARSAPDRRGALRAVRAAAGAWRQMVFHLTAAGPEVTGDLARSDVESVRPLLAGLRSVHEGARLVATRAPRSRAELATHPFLGWTTDGTHPILG